MLHTCLIFTFTGSACAAGADNKRQTDNSKPAPRFIDNANGTIKDNHTGLIWLKNADCFGIQTWDDSISLASKLANGQCGLKDGSKTGQWRLPNREELASMNNRQQINNSEWLNSQGFSNVQSDLYWSSTGSDNSTNIAWCADMNRGGVFDSGTNYSYHVWPVRGGD